MFNGTLSTPQKRLCLPQFSHSFNNRNVPREGVVGFRGRPLGAPARRHHLLQPLYYGSAPQRWAWRNISLPTGTCLLQHPASQKASPEVRGTNFKYKAKHTFFLGEKLNTKMSPVSSFKERVRVCKSRKGNNSQSFCWRPPSATFKPKTVSKSIKAHSPFAGVRNKKPKPRNLEWPSIPKAITELGYCFLKAERGS